MEREKGGEEKEEKKKKPLTEPCVKESLVRRPVVMRSAPCWLAGDGEGGRGERDVGRGEREGGRERGSEREG